MIDFAVTETWRAAHPGACAGILAMDGLANPPTHPALEERCVELEHMLRSRFAGGTRADLAALPVMQAYAAYYRRFTKTYHVLLQLDSVALKGRPIPRVAALVEAVFIAELDSGLLTAAHDLDAVRGAVRLDAARGDERYTALSGHEQELKAGDMLMADAEGVICSVLAGQDRRTRLQADTRRALFTVYAPPGIATGDVRRHLDAVAVHVRLIAPQARTARLEVFSAD